MSFDCADLERALREGGRTLERLRSHAETCASCCEELRLWDAISAEAPHLRRAVSSTDLWPRIEARIQQHRAMDRRSEWRAIAAAAAMLAIATLAAALLLRTPPATPSASREFLTEQALHEVERAEAAHREAIDRLSRLVNVQAAATPLALQYREKLLLLDSAIAELRVHAEANRFHASLRTELVTLYGEKQRTLQDLHEHETYRQAAH